MVLLVIQLLFDNIEYIKTVILEGEKIEQTSNYNLINIFNNTAGLHNFIRVNGKTLSLTLKWHSMSEEDRLLLIDIIKRNQYK